MHGHSLAQIISGSIRATDIAARYGGEEFAIILTDTGLDDALVLAERLRIDIAEYVFSFNNTVIPVTVSLGVGAQPDHTPSSFTELIRFADEALYRAKKMGRNQVQSFHRS